MNNNRLTELSKTDLGINVYEIYNNVKNKKNKIFVDLGVRYGTSSEVMLINSEIHNNKVIGVDVDNILKDEINNHPNYEFILGDSVTIGRYWDKKIDGIFIDTLHIKEQVLCELYFWYDHIQNGGFLIFHDTNWPENKNDIYDGVVWDRVEEAIKLFFNISKLDYEDEFIKVTNYPESWGMTIIENKKNKNYKKNITNWDEIFRKRNKLINFLWKDKNINNLKIDLNINV